MAADIAQDLNNQRPVTSGGTGAATGDAAAKSLGLVSAKDLAGINTVGGTANAITLATDRVYTVLSDSIYLSFKATADIADGGTTLALDGLAAKKIRKVTGAGDVDLTVGDIVVGGIYTLRYDVSADSAAGAFIVVNGAGGGGGAIQFLSEQNPAAASTVVFDTGFSTDYDEYIFQFIGCYSSSDGTNFQAELSQNAGASYFTSYDYACTFAGPPGGGGTATTFAGSAQTVMRLLLSVDSNSANGFFGKLSLFVKTTRASLISHLTGFTASGVIRDTMGSATAVSTARVNAIRWSMETGTMTGKIRMFGVRNS